MPLSGALQTKCEKEIAKIKRKVEQFQADRQIVITVILKKDNDVKGYIRRVGEDSFVVTDPKWNTSTTVRYADVADVKKQCTGSEWSSYGYTAY
jgi:hypothetical protein